MVDVSLMQGFMDGLKVEINAAVGKCKWFGVIGRAFFLSFVFRFILGHKCEFFNHHFLRERFD
jgi:hypothetical protein